MVMHRALLVFIVLAAFPAAWGTDYTVSTYAGMGAPGFIDGYGDSAKFQNPTDLGVDGAGNVYVADANNNRVRIIRPDRSVSTLAGGVPGSGPGFGDTTKSFGPTGPGEAAQLYGPMGLDVDRSGTVYVADTLNNKIKSITPGGEVTLLAGSYESYADGKGASAGFRKPEDVVASGDAIYVADTGNNRIRKIDRGMVVSTIAGDGTAGLADGQGREARFYNPRRVAADSAGNLYVADTGNHKIRRIAPDGAVTTIAGSGRGYADGPAMKAKFDNPSGLAFDSAGNLYVADTGNNKIRRIAPDGAVTTIAGSAPIAASHGYVDGTAAEAKFNGPMGVAVDAAGNIYVADTGNQRVRKISPVALSQPATTAPPVDTQAQGGSQPPSPQPTITVAPTATPSKGACGPTSTLLLAILPPIALNLPRLVGRWPARPPP